MVTRVTITPNRVANKRTVDTLNRLARKIEDPSDANRKVSIWLLRWVNENFRSQGGNVGKWAPFKYGGRKEKGGRINTSAKLLQKTGTLRASFLPFYSKSGAGVGSNLPYSEFHDIGVQANNLPRRQLVPDADDQKVAEAVIKIYDYHIKKAIS